METWKDKAELKTRVREWADKLDVDVRSLAIRPMKNKWASCSTKGCLNFDAALLNLEKPLGDYVIVHELLHLFVPNHGKLWKSLMLVHLGDYAALEKKLKQAVDQQKPSQEARKTL